MRISKQTDGTPGILQPPLDSADGKWFQSFYEVCCGNTIILQLQSSKSIYIQLTHEPCVETVEFQNFSSYAINYQALIPLISKWQKVHFGSWFIHTHTLHPCKAVDAAPKSQNFTAEETAPLACGMWRQAATWPS